jgi:hypothetical protein
MNEPPLPMFDEMPLRWNAASMKCRFDELPLWWNAASMKCRFDEMLLQWNAALIKCHIDEMLLQWNAALMKSCSPKWRDSSILLPEFKILQTLEVLLHGLGPVS